MFLAVRLAVIHQCMSDPTRLRLLNLLMRGPLCVCHFQTVLKEPQVKISKHLGYLRRRGLVRARREGNWMIYALPEAGARTVELEAGLECLRACMAGEAAFTRDLARLGRLDLSCGPVRTARGDGAPEPVRKQGAGRRTRCS